ncbi:MAG: recombinase family protein, partial [Ruminococcus sp.]|nr:recombinase family protein [Ruminococcus sp.]
MLNSLSAQISYYSELIQSHPGWLYCGVFFDEAYTGTKDNRTGFQNLISECRKGNIDLIITKSISRFARNTVTLLETVRELKLFGIDVFFEEQNIHTISADGELMMTILASYAQAESLSASENQKWRIRKAFENGEIVNLRFLFGYRIDGTKIEIDPAQADIVREVFERAVNGESFTSIANDLNNRIITRCLGGKWNSQRIRDLLSNEKYLGNALLQKKFTVDFLSKKMKINEGEVPQYYIENSHEAIIDPMEWDAVQDEFKRRKAIGRAYSGKSVFGAKIVCGDCGGFYGSKTWHSTDKYKTVIWQCNRKFKNNTCCKTPHITEDEIKERFLKVYNGLISGKEPFIKSCKLTRDVLTDTEEIDSEMSELLSELEVVTELIKKCIAENSSSAQDQEKYTERYN